MIGESEAAPASLFSNKTGGGSNRASYVGSISDEDGGDGDGDDDIRANTFVGTYMYMVSM